MMGHGAGPSIGHVVLTVRDIEASHRFYTTILGFEQCGTFHNESFPDVDMRSIAARPTGITTSRSFSRLTRRRTHR